MRAVAQLCAASAAALVLVPAALGSAPASERTEVVVALDAPSLATAIRSSRALSARTKASRLNLSSSTSRAYLAELDRAQGAVERRILRAIPSAQVRWRYSIVVDGLAVVVPQNRVADLSRIPGVADVYPSTRYTRALDSSPGLIGADQLWGLPDLTTAGNGVKIGIIDDGVDQAHPFFDATGYTYPAGFPKGDRGFTTPKVIAARTFVPASTTWKYARQPFDPAYSEHATHVAGIAAGDHGITAVTGRGTISGVAPMAYIGNYKALTVPTQEFGLDGNAPELAAAVEAAVRDGMDVINLSLGEPEIQPARDVLVTAINGAADAGVIPVVAAGNDFDSFGRGSLSSPGSASKAITVAAVTKNDLIAPFSSSGPTPISLGFKPDVSAPGVSILSSVPPRIGTWTSFSGTSMASPHTAGAAALLRQRHPDWSVAQIKSALVLTGGPVYADQSRQTEVPATREGGGLINLPRADTPLVFASPTGLSFGLMRTGTKASRQVALTDAGGGAGEWQVSVALQARPTGVTVVTPASLTVPGTLSVDSTVGAAAAEADVTGFVVLTRGTDTRRIPFWLRVESPKLAAPTLTLAKPGTYVGDTRKGKAQVSSYRYPDAPDGSGVVNDLRGPEQVFRVRISGRVANFGVRIVRQGPGAEATPRVVAAGDENRLAGYPALPLDINPYLGTFGDRDPVAGAIAPAPGLYDLVFDTVSPARAGPFTFRYWLNDTSPPKARLVTSSTARTGTLTVAVSDTGSGVDPSTLTATLDGADTPVTYRSGRVTVRLDGRLGSGQHTLVLSVSDYQETKNMENVGPILPNTRVLRTQFTVR